jgi:transcriptional regulator with XRE-family HTH domain
MVSFGRRLKKIRLERGLSSRELGRRADIPHETISRLENNSRANPSLPAAMRLAQALGVTLDYLAGMYEEEGEEEDEEPASVS